MVLLSCSISCCGSTSASNSVNLQCDATIALQRSQPVLFLGRPRAQPPQKRAGGRTPVGDERNKRPKQHGQGGGSPPTRAPQLHTLLRRERVRGVRAPAQLDRLQSERARGRGRLTRTRPRGDGVVSVERIATARRVVHGRIPPSLAYVGRWALVRTRCLRRRRGRMDGLRWDGRRRGVPR